MENQNDVAKLALDIQVDDYMVGTSRRINIIYEPYDLMYSTDAKIVVCDSGRITGKSTHIVDYIITNMMSKPRWGAVLARANFTDLSSSMFRLLLKRIKERELDEYWGYKLSPMEFTCNLNGNKAYFISFNARLKQDLTQTKGLEVEVPIGAVWLDEADQCYSGQHIDAGMDTLNRHLTNDGKYFFSFNRPQLKLHWAHKYFSDLKRSPMSIGLYATWLDIIDELDDLTIAMIMRVMREQPELYKMRYLNMMVNLAGLIYSQYKKRVHRISREDFVRITNEHIEVLDYLVFSVDPAIKKDSTGILCFAVMKSGVTFIVDQYKYDPIKYMPISTTRQAELLNSFTNKVIGLYNWVLVPKVFIFDAANQELMLSFRDLTNYSCEPYGKKHFWNDTQRVQDALDANMMYVVDNGGYYDYYDRNWVEGVNLLEDEIDSYPYDEKTNDVPDGVEDHLIACMRYGVGYIFPDKSLLQKAKEQILYNMSLGYKR